MHGIHVTKIMITIAKSAIKAFPDDILHRFNIAIKKKYIMNRQFSSV